MNISADKIERLIFVKYLLRQAEESKDLDRPLSSTTILTLHDGVECFLQLSYEHLTGKSKISGQQILDTYAEKINEILLEKSKPPINKAFIKRINELRNQLKHSTIFIDHRNIQNLYSETELFLIDFSLQVFNINFNEVSLMDLISNEHIKNHLIQANKDFKDNMLQSAMFSIAKAFYELEDIATKVKGKHGENILSSYQTVNYLIKYHSSFGGEEPSNMLKGHLNEIADDINKLQEEVDDLKKVISLSADLKKYAKFKSVIPFVTKIRKGDSGEVVFWIPDEESKRKVEYTTEQLKFCFDFVIEIALRHN